MAFHVLLARQRSGTGALGDILSQHPSVDYLGEVFHAGRPDQDGNYFRFLMDRVQQDVRRALPSANERNYREFMEYLRERHAAKPERVIDVKYNGSHHFNGGWHSPVDMPEMLRYFRRDGLKIVHLKRRSLLRTYVSGRIAEANRTWHTTDADAIRVPRIEVNPTALLNYLRSTQRTIEAFDRFLQGHKAVLELVYEDLFPRDATVDIDSLRRLAGFLGLEENSLDALRPSLVKQSGDDLAAVIENFDEVRAALLSTRFAGELDPA